MHLTTVLIFNAFAFLIGLSGMIAFLLGLYRIAKSSMQIEAVLENIQEQLK